jgi:acylphosphatase
MLEWCKKGPPHAIVNKVDAAEETYTGEFRDFRITY